MQLRQCLLPFEDIANRAGRFARMTLREEVGLLMLAARELTEAPVVLNEDYDADRPELGPFPGSKKYFCVRPTVEREAQGIWLQDPGDFSERRGDPMLIAVTGNLTAVAIPPSFVPGQVGGICEDEVEGLSGKLRKDFSAITVVEGDAIFFKIRFHCVSP